MNGARTPIIALDVSQTKELMLTLEGICRECKDCCALATSTLAARLARLPGHPPEEGILQAWTLPAPEDQRIERWVEGVGNGKEPVLTKSLDSL